jgi:putative DNA methylase
MATQRKLIEVALPLEAINRESAREKSIRHGHPSTLHLWWARRPLAACRAMLFASIVDDPSSHPEQFPTDVDQERERQRLFRLIEEMVKWENINIEEVMGRARAEILKATGGNPPPVLDPFCGGGSIPLEAQRLGLEAHASDLNPVAVLITKALIEIPPKFAGKPPVHPNQERQLMAKTWRGAEGLAEDVRYYGKWMRDEAEKRIGHLYPKAKLPKEHGGGEATVIAWLWARTVKCPNPSCGARMPLVHSFALSTKPGKQVWVEPVVDRSGLPNKVSFQVRSGMGRPREGTVNRRGAICICCGTPVPFEHIRNEGKAGRLSSQLLAMAVEGNNGRAYLPATDRQELTAVIDCLQDTLDTDLPERALSFRVQLYGMSKHRDLFSARQLVALSNFSDLVSAARDRVLCDVGDADGSDDGTPLGAGRGATAYSDAVSTYLALAVDRSADFWSTIATWSPQPKNQLVVHTFARQALPMTWDYAEANPFSNSGGNFEINLSFVVKVIQNSPIGAPLGQAHQCDAAFAVRSNPGCLISTDPPYYDNIGYADLSDFFYIWMRRSLGAIYPDLFDTLLTPRQARTVHKRPSLQPDGKRCSKPFYALVLPSSVLGRYEPK